MLILDRKCDEQIVIGDNIVLKIVEVRRGSVRIGIEAPKHIPIARDELLHREPKPTQSAKQ